MDEAAIVVKIVNDLLAPGDLQPEDIGIISPYAGQVRLIKDMIGEIEGLEIKSVDGYQGERRKLSFYHRSALTSKAKLVFFRISAD